ncbi:LysR family transcriptional regulator [Planomonospora venezuelensis]|uniref:DNA-binding transcriptional LysR family regulator n=1 Tax=Planomonospora venezuelensis TaxID=1999 RepID=A0A841D566_PLAVE|nr:LysR family transcriptional regulator [Planomonospora venezuelensis]MBB5965381.1 DNA-binding transcriptional LysR family regulator [Planomonospora venezuelensis]GIN05150.1 LysR family transcriptional regulator [Planomonospora venezuelensis]
MDPHRLLVFREVARAGSIAGAARSLGWTQPAVSQHLRHLERRAGVALVVRRPRGVRLTEAGEVLLRHADAVAVRLHAADDDLAALAQLRQGTVRLAAFPSASAAVVPAAMSLLGERHPGVDVRLREAEPPEALALLAAGEADLAVTFSHPGQEPDDHPGLVREAAGEDAVLLVLPDSHPQAVSTGPPVELRSLAAEKWIAGCERCAANLRRTCEEAGFVPDVRHGTDDYVVTQALIARGLGIGLLPRLALDAFTAPGVAVRPVPGLRPRSLHLVHPREADQIPAVRAAVRALRDVLAPAPG